MKNEPLTQMEQAFADANHYLVERFLQQKCLDKQEWYDVVIFRYLLSVQRYIQQPKLRKWRFSTIAYKAMSSAVYTEREKQKLRIQCISLEEIIPGTEGVTYGDTITYENMNYLKGNAMKIVYNVKQLPERPEWHAGIKSDEVKAIESFFGTKAKNMCFEYDTTEEAKKKVSTVKSFKSRLDKAGPPETFAYYRVENCIYITRERGKK